ncbi:UNVERIFIED_CONTAM: hypothetical protein FKN15_069524 [Acipenser sinensis]
MTNEDSHNDIPASVCNGQTAALDLNTEGPVKGPYTVYKGIFRKSKVVYSNEIVSDCPPRPYVIPDDQSYLFCNSDNGTALLLVSNVTLEHNSKFTVEYTTQNDKPGSKETSLQVNSTECPSKMTNEDSHNDTNTQSNLSEGPNIPVLCGSVAGVVALLVALALAGYCLIKRKKNRKDGEQNMTELDQVDACSADWLRMASRLRLGMDINQSQAEMLKGLLRTSLSLCSSYCTEIGILGRDRCSGLFPASDRLLVSSTGARGPRRSLQPLQGSNYYVRILSTIDRELLKPNASVALHKHSNALVDVLPPEADSSIMMLTSDQKPDVLYSDIGGMDIQKQEVREAVELPLTHFELYKQIGIDPPRGVLMYGPPGCGKTMLAKAVAHHTTAAFIRVVGSEFVQKYLGEGPRMVRDVFRLAKENAPAIIFIDEIDAIATKRFDAQTGADREVQRILLELLNQMDGFDQNVNVKVIMATNRADTLDPALLRPGRLDRKIEFPLPDRRQKRLVFSTITSKMNLSEEVDLEDCILSQARSLWIR